MAYMGNRTRFKTVPGRISSSGVLGKFFVEHTPGSKDWRPISTVYSVGQPYLKAARITDEVHPGPPWRSGGPFEKIELGYPSLSEQGQGTYISPSNFTFSGVGNGKVKYEGRFSIPITWPGFNLDFMNLQLNLGINSPLIPNTGSLEDRVWDRTKPQIEQGGLAVALAEIRDVPGMLKTSLKGFMDIYRKVGGKSIKGGFLTPKKAADHFLNHSFGWVPFISDLSKFCDNITNVDSRIERLRRENGVWTKRKVILVNNTETNDLGWGEQTLVYPASDFMIRDMYIPGWNPYYNIVETKTTVAHGVGRFRYYQPYFDDSLPDANSALGSLRRQLALHGARLTPVNVYRAIPWTWLVDWGTHAGSSFQAIQDSYLDGMAAKYLYLTHHQLKEQVVRQFLPFVPQCGGIKELSFARIIDVKQRKEADAPFGFGLDVADLSPRQLAILAALGISRR
jgi:hypothetical protein